MLPPGAIFKLKIHQNAYEALGEITELAPPARLHNWFSGSRLIRGRGGEGKNGEEKEGNEEKGRG